MEKDISPTDRRTLGFNSFLFELAVPDYYTELETDIILDELAEKERNSKSSIIRLLNKLEKAELIKQLGPRELSKLIECDESLISRIRHNSGYKKKDEKTNRYLTDTEE
ncbi:MAG: hypothetical protein EZS28_051550, partial [Streblomastix strix]